MQRGISTTTSRAKFHCENGQCYPHPTGQYTSMAQCQASCNGEVRWLCENGQCYQNPNGQYLSYNDCKTNCKPPLPCSLTIEACADYYNVLNGTSAYTMSFILTHWENYFNSLGYGVSQSQLLNILQICCTAPSRKMLNLTNPTGSVKNDLRIRIK